MRSTGTMGGGSRFVLAALDSEASTAVEACAEAMGGTLGLPVRRVHIHPGPGLRGEAQRSALARVMRGERAELDGRPEDILTRLVHVPDTVVCVIGIRRGSAGQNHRRGSGTALAVARRVQRPMLCVPATAVDWSGPKRALVALDGSGATAVAAARALSWCTGGDVTSVAVRIGEAGSSNGPARTTGGRHILGELEDHGCDLIVLTWDRQTRGSSGAMVLDVLGHTPVPVLLTPVDS